MAELAANASVFARRTDADGSGYLSGEMLCFDALGEFVFGLNSIALIGIEYNKYYIRVYWLALLPAYMY